MGIVKTNQDIFGKQRVRNDDCEFAVSDEDKKIASKSYHKRLLSTDFTCDKNSLSAAAAFSDVYRLKDKIMVRGSICNMKNGKAVRPS